MSSDFILGHYTVVPSSDNNDDSISVAVISGAIVGTLIIVMIIVIAIILVVIMVLYRGRKKSKEVYNIDDKYVTIQPSSNLPNRQQHTHNTSDQSQHDDTDNDASSQLGVHPTSRLEIVNALYIPTNVKSVEQHGHDRSRSAAIGYNVIITPNPSYILSPNSIQTEKESEYQYDYVQTDDKLVQRDKVLELTTSGEANNKITNPAGNVNIDHNPSYFLLQDIKLEDNPSYRKLQLQL